MARLLEGVFRVREQEEERNYYFPSEAQLLSRRRPLSRRSSRRGSQASQLSAGSHLPPDEHSTPPPPPPLERLVVGADVEVYSKHLRAWVRGKIKAVMASRDSSPRVQVKYRLVLPSGQERKVKKWLRAGSPLLRIFTQWKIEHHPSRVEPRYRTLQAFLKIFPLWQEYTPQQMYDYVLSTENDEWLPWAEAMRDCGVGAEKLMTLTEPEWTAIATHMTTMMRSRGWVGSSPTCAIEMDQTTDDVSDAGGAPETPLFKLPSVLTQSEVLTQMRHAFAFDMHDEFSDIVLAQLVETRAAVIESLTGINPDLALLIASFDVGSEQHVMEYVYDSFEQTLTRPIARISKCGFFLRELELVIGMVIWIIAMVAIGGNIRPSALDAAGEELPALDPHHLCLDATSEDICEIDVHHLQTMLLCVAMFVVSFFHMCWFLYYWHRASRDSQALHGFTLIFGMRVHPNHQPFRREKVNFRGPYSLAKAALYLKPFAPMANARGRVARRTDPFNENPEDLHFAIQKYLFTLAVLLSVILGTVGHGWITTLPFAVYAYYFHFELVWVRLFRRRRVIGHGIGISFIAICVLLYLTIFNTEISTKESRQQASNTLAIVSSVFWGIVMLMVLVGYIVLRLHRSYLFSLLAVQLVVVALLLVTFKAADISFDIIFMLSIYAALGAWESFAHSRFVGIQRPNKMYEQILATIPWWRYLLVPAIGFPDLDRDTFRRPPPV